MPCETCVVAAGSSFRPRSEWLCVSMNPGAIVKPLASITRAPSGKLVSPRLPAATIESPLMTTTALLTGEWPEPSSKVAPVIATTSSGDKGELELEFNQEVLVANESTKKKVRIEIESLIGLDSLPV